MKEVMFTPFDFPIHVNKVEVALLLTMQRKMFVLQYVNAWESLLTQIEGYGVSLYMTNLIFVLYPSALKSVFSQRLVSLLTEK